jgi:uncharacterized repeat protein (TIGR01451 family)
LFQLRAGCSQSGGTVACNLGDLASGATVPVTIVVMPTQTGTITNTASVTSSVNDSNTANNTATTSTTVNAPSANLSISLSDSPDPVQVGSNLTYTVNVFNNGPSTATGVTVTDSLPSSVTFVSVTSTQGTCTGTSAITCNLGTLNSGTSARVIIVVTPTRAGTITNTASVTATEPDPNQANNTASQNTTVLAPRRPLEPVARETGRVSLSIDGLGTSQGSGIIQVEKPAGATVRKAFLAAAAVFGFTDLPNGNVRIDGVGVNWDLVTSTSISSVNTFADVTSIVKPKIDAAAAGRVDFAITEINSSRIDGETLAVIFDDPNQTTTNTVILLFGAQDVRGDSFAIGLAEPINKSDPNLVLNMSLGISFGFQSTNSGGQHSTVDVNGQRLSSSAGGQDDGDSSGSGLLTVGGLDDSNANPVDPLANSGPAGFRTDDELYDLRPFVADGEMMISVATRNPSNDDNIFFAGFFLGSTNAVVGEGIILSPASATNPVGTQHTVTATLQDNLGNPVANRQVNFEVVSGPQAGLTAMSQTDATGRTTFTYTGTAAGTDQIVARTVNSRGETITSNTATKEWTIALDSRSAGGYAITSTRGWAASPSL